MLISYWSSDVCSSDLKHTEGDGKDEAPQSSDHPHSPANLADMVRVIDGDVLEHRGLAQAHEEAEDGHRHQEGRQPHFGAEADRPARAIDDIGRGRVGEHEDAEHADAEYDIHQDRKSTRLNSSH